MTTEVNVKAIQELARQKSLNLEKMRAGMLKMGFKPDGVNAFVDSRQTFLHGLQTTTPSKGVR